MDQIWNEACIISGIDACNMVISLLLRFNYSYEFKII